MRYTQISIDVRVFDRLWQSKERFRKIVDGKLTWTGFIEQATLALEAQRSLLPSVKATRYNPHVYGAECPICKTEKYPLRVKKVVAWMVKCSGCGKEYIALT